MEAGGAENGVKLQRGRISLERKREILEQYDLLSQPCSETDAAAIFGVKKATLLKILSERDHIEGAVTIKTENVSSPGEDEAEGGAASSGKLKRGRLSYEKQKELLTLYDQLPAISHSEAAAKLGVREVTLIKLLARRRSINSGKRKRKKVNDSSSDSDNNVTPRIQSASGLRRGAISTERQIEVLEQYDKLRKPVTHQAAASKLGISQTALTNLLTSREARRARLSPQPGGSGKRSAGGRSPQPGSSGLKMALRKNRRVRVDFSDDDQSGSDYNASDSDSTDDEDAEGSQDGDHKPTRKKKHYSLAEKKKMLEKYDELLPCPQWRVAQMLGITQSTLCNWLHQRANSSQSKRIKIKSEEEDDKDSNISGEEIDSYVMGSTNGTQVIQFFEVSAEEQNKKSSDSTDNDPNPVTRKPYMTLREKFELYRKYDSMDPDAQRKAADTFNLPKSTWCNLIANRYNYEKRFKTMLRKDMEVLNKYDDLETKRNAPKVLNVLQPKLKKILENRAIIEKYYTELFGSNEDGESVALSVEEPESTWKESKALKVLETELLHWFQQAKDDQVNWEVLKAKAKELAANSGMDDFFPSDAWLKKWNKTNRVFWSKKGKLISVYGFGENRSMSECVLTALKDYPPENVFNLVETGLYYRALRGHSPVTNDWVTVAFACNMSGTEKKRALVVGKSEAPLCFRVMPLPLEYKYSRSASMTEEIVCNFLRDWNKELAESNRAIALILDASTSHPNIQLSRIRLFFVPTECSAAQPLNDGIVGHAKGLFRKRMADSLKSLGRSRTNQSAAENIAVVDALFALAEAWENVPKSLLVSKFLNSTFPQNDAGEPHKDELDDEELERLNKLDDEIQLHSTSDGLPCLKFTDKEMSELEGGHVVHMEGTLNLSDEEEEDFDIDSLLRDQDTTDCNASSNCGQNSSPDLGSKLKNFLQKAPNGSLPADQKGCAPPTASDVRGALATIKKFLQVNGCTLEDLTDFTQLEIKVLSKIKNTSATSKHS